MNAITRMSEPLFREIIPALLRETFPNWKPIGFEVYKNGLSIGVNAVMQDQWMGSITEESHRGKTYSVFNGTITTSYEEAIEELKEYVKINHL